MSTAASTRTSIGSGGMKRSSCSVPIRRRRGCPPRRPSMEITRLSVSELPDESPASGPDREPDRELLAPLQRTRKRQADDVGARDEQHEADHREQSPPDRRDSGQRARATVPLAQRGEDQAPIVVWMLLLEPASHRVEFGVGGREGRPGPAPADDREPRLSTARELVRLCGHRRPTASSSEPRRRRERTARAAGRASERTPTMVNSWPFSFTVRPMTSATRSEPGLPDALADHGDRVAGRGRRLPRGGTSVPRSRRPPASRSSCR